MNHITICEACKQENEVLAQRDQYGWSVHVCRNPDCDMVNRILQSRAFVSPDCGHEAIGHRQSPFMPGRPPSIVYTCRKPGCPYYDFTQSRLWDEEAQQPITFKAVVA